MRACWLKWVGRDWSISADYIWLNYSDANNSDVIRLITCQPNGGHKANETLSQFKPRPSSPDRLGGSAGSLVLALPMGIVWGVSAGTTRIPFFECSTVSLN